MKTKRDYRGFRSNVAVGLIEVERSGATLIYGVNARDLSGGLLALSAGQEGIVVNRINHRFYFIIADCGLATLSFTRRPLSALERIENVNLLDNGWRVYFLFDAAAAPVSS